MNPEIANAFRLLQSGDALQAAAVCRDLLKRNPDNGHVMQLLGVSLRKLGNFEEAEQHLRRSVELSPANAEFRTNLAQLLGARGKHEQSAGEFRSAVALDARFRPALNGLARAAARLLRYEEAERAARTLVALKESDSEAWVLLGSVLHGAGRWPQARQAMERAAKLAPKHAPTRGRLAALLCDQEHAEAVLAQVAEAGRLGLADRALTMSQARALMQLDRYEEAEAVLAPLVAAAPADTESQFLLVQLRHVRGDPDFARALREAAARPDAAPPIRLLLADVLRRAGQAAAAEHMLRTMVGAYGPHPGLLGSLGALLQESGRFAEALDLTRQAAASQPEDVTAAENFVAAALCAGDPQVALPTIERFAQRTPTDQRWITYRADVARQRGEDLYAQWCDLDRVVQVFDIEPPPGYSSLEEFHAAVRPALEARHRQKSHPLDQSLRHGTQTSRGLLVGDDPLIRALLDAMADPIARYQSAMLREEAHPLYRRNVAPARMVGCWSVRLQRGGFHVNHIHPQGWISSAYYVSVPAEVADTSLRSGWIKFGEPRFPTPACEAGRFVQPKPGRLVLFPSYLWHGTTPIHGDEPRLTIAFDAAP